MHRFVKLTVTGVAMGMAISLTHEADLPHTELRSYEETLPLTYEMPNSTATMTFYGGYWFDIPTKR